MRIFPAIPLFQSLSIGHPRSFRRGFNIVWLNVILVALAQSGIISPLFAANTITTNQLGQGIVYKHYHYDNLAGGKQEIYIADINLTDPAVSIAFPNLSSGRTVTAHAATVSSAAVAVNGQFFTSTGPIQFLKVQGVTKYQTQAGAHDDQAVVDDGFHLTNSIRILLRPGAGNSWSNSAVSNIMACGVALVQNGVKVTGYDTNDPYITKKNPRTSVAITIDNHLLLECVDGRTTNSLGMTIPEMRDDIFTRGTIQQSFGLDGGGSTEMWARTIGVANHPSDGVERAVADAVVIATTPPALPAPPINLAGTSLTTNIALSWQIASGAMGYNVKRSTSSNGPFVTVLTTIETSCTNTDVAANTQYYYVVSAFNSIGESSNSTYTSIITGPAAPANLAAVPGNNLVILNWSASANATGYTISRGTVSGGPYTPVLQTAGTSITNTGLADNTVFYFVVAATNSNGSSPPSAQAAAAPQCFTPLATSGLQAMSGANGIGLIWLPVAQAQSYIVNRATKAGGPYVAIASTLGTNYTDGNIATGTVYFYTISSRNSCGTTASTDEVSAPLLFVGSSFSPTNIVLRGWGGVADQTYFVLSAPQVNLPAADWTPIATNTFGSSGSFNFTNPIAPTSGLIFYRILTTQP